MTAVRETTSVKLDKKIKEEAKLVFSQLGISMGDAINMFLAQVSMTKGLPFDVKIPNEETKKAMIDAMNGVNLEPFSIEDLKADRNENS